MIHVNQTEAVETTTTRTLREMVADAIKNGHRPDHEGDCHNCGFPVWQVSTKRCPA